MSDTKKEVSTRDIVNPTYYKVESFEVIDIIEEFKLNYNLGNVVKYVLRAGKKGDPAEDLGKANWYLERELFKHLKP